MAEKLTRPAWNAEPKHDWPGGGYVGDFVVGIRECPQEPGSVKLTPAQKRLLADVRAGKTLRREFDVWGGYWWELDGNQINSRPPQGLLDAALIALMEVQHRFSGRQTRLAKPIKGSGRNLADANSNKDHPR